MPILVPIHNCPRESREKPNRRRDCRESRAGLREVLHLPRAQVDAVKPVAIRPDPQPSAVDGERMDVERPVAGRPPRAYSCPYAGCKGSAPRRRCRSRYSLGILAEFADDMPAPLAGLDEREKRTERRECVDAAEIGSDPHAAVTILEDGGMNLSLSRPFRLVVPLSTCSKLRFLV